MADIHHIDLAGVSFSSGADLGVWFIQEDSLRKFKTPAAADCVLVNGEVSISQVPELKESDARTTGDRMLKASIAGRIDHIEVPIPFECRAPGVLGGTDTIMGAAVLEALMGESSIPNSQAAVDIENVISWGRDECTFNVDTNDFVWSVGQVIALRSNNAATAKSSHMTALITSLTDQGGAGAGGVDIKVQSGWLNYPQHAALAGITTPDQVQGGVTWRFTKGWTTTHSMVVVDGYDGYKCSGGVVNSFSAGIDGRGLLTFEADAHFQKAIPAARAVSGGGVAGQLDAVELTVQVDDTEKFEVGSLVQFVERDTGTTVNIEGPLEIESIDSGTSQITVKARGGTPIDTPSTQVDTTAYDVAGPYDTSTKNVLRVNIDNRGELDITLTSGAGTTAATLAADINAALKSAADYGQDTIGPYSGISWEAAATDESGTLRLNSQVYGHQSRIVVSDTGAASSAHDLVFTTAFDLSAGWQLNVEPYDPTCAETREPLCNKDNICVIDGYDLLGSAFNLTISNEAEWLEDIKTGDDYALGHLPGIKRRCSIEVTVPAFGWTGRLQQQARSSSSAFFHLIVGKALGKTFSVIMPAGVISAPEPSGEVRRDKSFTVVAQDPGITDLKECYLALT